MPANIPLINGQAYAWGNVDIDINGAVISGIVSIEYKETMEITDVHGAGQVVVARGYGKITASGGKLVLHKNEVVALRRTVPSGKLRDIKEFPIVVSWEDDTNDGYERVTEVIYNCRFKDDGTSIKSGDMNEEVSIDFAFSHFSAI